MKRNGFTLVELLTVLAIIAMLLGLFVPSMTMIRGIAREAVQRSRLDAIETSLLIFRNDNNFYPQSSWMPGSDYCGAQKLAEAVFGQDLRGFHPGATFTAADPIYNSGTFDYRREHYLNLKSAKVFRLGDLFDDTLTLHPGMHVLCDIFVMKKVTVEGKRVSAGAPILYYKANTSSRTIDFRSVAYQDCIYDARDSDPIIAIKAWADRKRHVVHPLNDGSYSFFYEKYIVNPKVTLASGVPWPYRADSFLLVSAGVDGLYGTRDDICNFGL